MGLFCERLSIPLSGIPGFSLVSGDDLKLQIERSVQAVLSQWVGTWGGGWLPGFSGLTYTLDPYNESGFRASRDQDGGIVDATEVVAYYLQTLPGHVVTPSLGRVKLLRPLPKPIWKNREIQPLKGAVRVD